MDIFTLPNRNLVTHILEYLPYRDIAKLSYINRKFNLLCLNEPLIKTLIVTKRTDHLLQKHSQSHLALEDACSYGDLEVVNELINRGVDPSLNENNALKISIEYNRITSIKRLLIDPRVDPSFESWALNLAIEHNRSDIVQILLRDIRICEQIRESELLIQACRRGNTELCRLLVEHVNPARRDNQSIISVAFQGHVEIVDLLLKQKEVDPTARDNGAIAWVNVEIERGSEKHGEVMKRLLEDERVYWSLSEDARSKYRLMGDLLWK